MSCVTMNALQPMATTQFMRAAYCERCVSVEKYFTTQHLPLRMNWVVVTDDNGNRRLQIDWHADRGD